MQRLPALMALAILAISIASCGGGGGSSSTPATLALSPSPMTLSYGEVLAVSPTFKNGDGTQVFPASVSYQSSNTAVATVSSSGQVCAGTWDSSFIVCTPATSPGTATITVSGGGVSSTTTVFVHAKVDRIVISGSVDLANCLSIAATSPANSAKLSASAYSNNVDVTSSIGPFSWKVVDSAVASVDTSGRCTTDNTCVITAVAPGQTSVYASLGTSAVTTSTPGVFTSCPVQSISLHMPNATTDSVSLNASGTQALAVDVYDTKGNKLVDSNGALLSAATPKYYTSQPLSATVTAGTITAASAGTSATVSAVCSPSTSCNTNLSPVYSNAFTVKVNSGSTANTTTVYVASTKGTSLVPVDTGTNTAGATITLPNTPNSIAAARTGASVYLGSSNGLMVVSTSVGTVATISTLPGKVISISPDSHTVLVYNPPASAPGTGTLFRYFSDGTSNSIPITSAGTSATASWTPDSSLAYVVTGTRLLIQPAGGTGHTFDVGQVNDLDFLAQGSFAYLAGGGADVTVRATCNNAVVDSKSVGGVPAIIRSLPNATAVLALYPGDLSAPADRFINPIAVTTTGAGCPPAVTNTPAGGLALPGAFIPGQMVLTPDSSKAFVTALDRPTVYSYDVASKTVTAIPLQGSGVTGAYGAGITLDSSRLYVTAAGSNDLHVINTGTNADTAQISIGFQPDLIAVKPR